MKRICPYFAMILWCCVPVMAGPFSIPTKGPFTIPKQGPFVIDVPDEPSKPRFRTVTRYRTERYAAWARVPCRFCSSGFSLKAVWKSRRVPYPVQVPVVAEAAATASTPMAEVNRMVALVQLPKGSLILEPGCGGDARIAIALAKAGYRVRAYEIDHDRYEQAKAAVKKAGYQRRIWVQYGDVNNKYWNNTDVDGVVAYMYPGVLTKLTKTVKGKKLKRFVSYMHDVDGLKMTKTGNIYVWSKPVPVRARRTYRTRNVAYWKGQAYYGPVCDKLGCPMCSSIRRQLQASRSVVW